MIDLRGLNKAKVLVALVDGAKRECPQLDTYTLSAHKAEEMLFLATLWRGEKPFVFEGVWSRNLGLDLSGDELDPTEYNRHNGEGAAERIITELRQGAQVRIA